MRASLLAAPLAVATVVVASVWSNAPAPIVAPDVRARVAVGDAPGALAAAFGSVWVANRGSHTVSRIDPGSDRVIATMPLGGEPSGLGAGPGGLWVALATPPELVRVDPTANRVVGRVPDAGAHGAVTTGAGSVWTAAGEPRTVLRIDPATGRVQAVVAVPGDPVDLAFAAGSVWAAARDGTVVRIDPGSDAAVATVPVGARPRELEFALRFLLVATEHDAVRVLDLATHAVTPLELSERNAVALTRGGGAAFTRHAGSAGAPGALLHVDPQSLRVERRYALPAGEGDLVYLDDMLWIAMPGQDAVWRAAARPSG